MSFNRYRVTRKSIEETREFLMGRRMKSKSPKYAVVFQNELEFKGKQLLYRGLPVIPIEELDEFFRKQVYTKGSTVPLNRDQGYIAISKLAWGLPQSRNRVTNRALRRPVILCLPVCRFRSPLFSRTRFR